MSGPQTHIEPDPSATGTAWSQRDRVAIVTGGGSGIGQACALAFANAGANVVIVDNRRQAAEGTLKLVEDAGGKAVPFVADVSEPAEVEAMVALCLSDFGRVDILVNNAGTAVVGSAIETSVEDFDRTMAVNVRGVFLGVRAVLPEMIERGGGIIVNMASAVVANAVTGRAAYMTSKGAVAAFTKAVALEHMAQGIRCNAIAPGVVDSPWVEAIIAQGSDPIAIRENMAARQPLGRMAQPDEIAAAVMYLCSYEARFINGSCLFIDGGFST